MKVSMIAAMSQNRVIGINNDLPWYLPDDFRFFQQTTTGHHIIMGRKNFESLPPKFKPLPDRHNLVLTRNKDFSAKGTIVFHELTDAIDYASVHDENELFIIGGGEIYELGLEFADRIYLTEIQAHIEGHTYFPTFDKTKFVETKRSHHAIDSKHIFAFDFVIYDKN
jgi:dihydrofolate reductase